MATNQSECSSLEKKSIIKFMSDDWDFVKKNKRMKL